MTLNITTKSTHHIDMYDLCKHLSEKMGRKVEFGDTPNDTDYAIDLVKEEIADYDQETIDGFLEDGYLNMDYGWSACLTHCVNEGWLEEGSYVFSVCW